MYYGPARSKLELIQEKKEILNNDYKLSFRNFLKLYRWELRNNHFKLNEIKYNNEEYVVGFYNTEDEKEDNIEIFNLFYAIDKIVYNGPAASMPKLYNLLVFESNDESSISISKSNFSKKYCVIGKYSL